MDIAFVTSQVFPYRKGGTEKRVFEIGRRLAQDGHDVTIYGCKWWSGPAETELEGMELRGVCEPGEQYTDGRRSILEALRFSATLVGPLFAKRDDHDLVVACVSEHFPVWVSALVSQLGTAEHVTTWHEVWDYDYWTDYLGSMGAIGWAVQSITANLPQRPVTVSELTAERLESISANRKRVEVVPNGVDVEKIRSTPAVDDGYDLLFVGRLIEEKNVDLLLSAFDELAAEHDVTLGVIGDGPRRDELRDHARSLTHSDRVTFLGFVESDRGVYGHMHAADVFALPSVREGFGITVLESMAAGCIPVVASHPDSAATEVVGDCGFVAQPDVSPLADALERALTEEVGNRDPVEHARDFRWDRVTALAEEVYQNESSREAIGQRPSATGESA